MNEMKYYHGGAPNLKVILPPNLTKANTSADFGNHLCDRDSVYITNDYTSAVFYAAFHPSKKGTVYEVEPLSELEPDEDFDNSDGEIQSYKCTKARIKKAERLKTKVIFKIRKSFAREQK